MVRIFGLMATMAGTVFTSWGIYHYYHPAEARKWAEYRGTADQSFSHQTINPDTLGGVVTVEIAVGIFALILAFAVLGVRPYRPDLGDAVSSYSVGTRSWWTGEPKTVATKLMPNQEDAPDQKAVR
jgi:hypothetical protein